MEDVQCDKQNYNAIDLAKFICAILVVMIHVPPFGTSIETKWIDILSFFVRNYLARIAVPFFFVTSGFFLYKKTSLNELNISLIKQYVLKLLRFYILWSAIYFPFNLMVIISADRPFYAGVGYIRDFIFFRSYSHLWYLNATIFAVVLITYLLYKRITIKKILVIAFIFYFAGLFAQSWFGLILPLKENAPHIWTILKLIQMVIVTTRDGLFAGFLFVGLGMLFAFDKVNMTRKQALIGFVVSMTLMFIEVFSLEYFNFIREYDKYLFLVPATFFMFSIIRDIKLPDHKIYKNLRILSSLVFFIHPWIQEIVKKVLSMISEGLETTCLSFVVTLVMTIICSIITIKASNTTRFKWLKNLYI